MEPSGIFFTIVVILVARWLIQQYIDKHKLPPGPLNLPVIGSILSMDGIGSKGCVDPKFLKYGELYTLFIGSVPLIIVNSFQVTKELFSREDISLRRKTWWTLNVRGDGKRALGIINTSGEVWQAQRRFALRQLREFGFGKRSLDSVIQSEVNWAINRLLEQGFKEDVLMDANFNVPIINILWEIVAGQRFDPDDKNTKEMMTHLNEVFRVGYSILHYLPIARFVISKDERMEKMLKLKDFFRKQIREHMINFDQHNPRDFIDVYIKQIQDDQKFDVEQLVTMCLDFFQAGAETSATTLLWCIQYLSLYPDVQKKCKDEIEDILIKGESPSQEMVPKLPYCSATLMEIQRVSHVAPMSLPHVTEREVQIRGYTIPKGTEIFANIKAFHSNPELFPDPLEFKPERFLTEDGSRTKKVEEFIPFGVGKRVCMGESLARHQLFIFFINFLMKLNVQRPKNHQSADPEECFMGITRIPKPFYVQISPA